MSLVEADRIHHLNTDKWQKLESSPLSPEPRYSDWVCVETERVIRLNQKYVLRLFGDTKSLTGGQAWRVDEQDRLAPLHRYTSDLFTRFPVTCSIQRSYSKQRGFEHQVHLFGNQSASIRERLQLLLALGFPFETNLYLSLQDVLRARSRNIETLHTVFAVQPMLGRLHEYDEQISQDIAWLNKWRFRIWKPHLHAHCFGPWIHTVIKALMIVSTRFSLYLPLEMWCVIISFFRRGDFFQISEDIASRSYRKLSRERAEFMTKENIKIRKETDLQVLQRRLLFSQNIFSFFNHQF
jgi:hypothetical protein